MSDVEDRLTRLENKLDFVLEQIDLVLKSNAHLKADIPEIIKDSVHSVFHKRAVQGYSRINS